MCRDSAIRRIIAFIVPSLSLRSVGSVSDHPKDAAAVVNIILGD